MFYQYYLSPAFNFTCANLFSLCEPLPCPLSFFSPTPLSRNTLFMYGFIALCIDRGFLFINLMLTVLALVILACCPWQWEDCEGPLLFFYIYINSSKEACRIPELLVLRYLKYVCQGEKCSLNSEQIRAYLSLPHSSIHASKSSHLNSWKT